MLSGALLASANFSSEKTRARLTRSVLLAFLVLTLWLPIPTTSFVMGDGSSIIQDRSSFNEMVDPGGRIRFSAHLAYLILLWFDQALGASSESPAQAYRVLSWLAGALFAVSLGALAAVERWSPRAVRYVGLAMCAPATVMYFGYLEVGYLALSAAAFPFVARDLDQGPVLTAGVLAGALLYGLGAAFHGVGYIGIAGMCAALLASRGRIRARMILTVAAGAIAVGAALIWLWYYLAVLGLNVIPHHAVGGVIQRPLWDPNVAESRIVYPLFSAIAARDLLLSGFVAGVPVLLVVLVIARTSWSPEVRSALAFSVPSLAFFLVFWPVQGIAIEMDMIVAAFPAIYPLLWVASRFAPASVASASLLATGHWIFWRVVLDTRFINDMVKSLQLNLELSTLNFEL
jgi:hypothetical protein